MTNPRVNDPDPTPFVTLAEASRAALRIGARMSLPERIRWLEEAEEFGLQSQLWRWQRGMGVDRRLRPLFEIRHGPARAVAEAPARYEAEDGR